MRIFLNQLHKNILNFSSSKLVRPTPHPLQLSQPTFVNLQNRTLIVIHGPDTRKLVQGTTTNNISNLYQAPPAKGQQPQVAQYTLFLGPKGKIITDAIILRPALYKNGKKQYMQQQLWIDVAKQNNVALMEHLKRYIWKKKVQLLNLAFQDDKPQIFAGFVLSIPEMKEGDQQFFKQAGRAVKIETKNDQKQIRKRSRQQIKQQDEDGVCNLGFYDPRDPRLGIRLVVGPDGFGMKSGQVKLASIKQYQKVCQSLGISSSTTMTSKLPFMFNSDLLNGFSFKKGCYIGQQIVSRSYNTGIIRRRIFPFSLDLNKKLQQGTILYGENKQQIGKVMESQQGYGTVLCTYLPFMQKPWPLKIEEPVKGVVKMPFQYMLNTYIQQMKSKQAKLQQLDI